MTTGEFRTLLAAYRDIRELLSGAVTIRTVAAEAQISEPGVERDRLDITVAADATTGGPAVPIAVATAASAAFPPFRSMCKPACAASASAPRTTQPRIQGARRPKRDLVRSEIWPKIGLAMVAISEGAKQETLNRIAVLGVDNIMLRSVKPSQTDSAPQDRSQEQSRQAEYGLLRRDLNHVRQAVPEVRHAVGLRNMRT